MLNIKTGEFKDPINGKLLFDHYNVHNFFLLMLTL